MAQVRTLLGSAQLTHALPCLESLLRWSLDPLELVIHDDGTLAAEDMARLTTCFPGVSVLDRRSADARVEPFLLRYPRLTALRRANPLYIKLLDVRLLAPEALVYIDADVLFLQPFRGLFLLPDWADAAFMLDSQHAYALRSWETLRSRVRLAGHVNTGVVLFRGPLDLDALEWLVTRPGFGQPPAWAEQTAWALLAARVRSAHVDPGQLTFPGSERQGTVGLHFISPLRGQLPAFLDDRSQRANLPVRIRFRPAQTASSLALAAGEAQRRLRRVFRH